MRKTLVCLAVVWTGLCSALSAQDVPAELPVAIVADSLVYDAEAGTLTAEGNVEVVYQDNRLTADGIVYDQESGTIRATGDIRLQTAQGPVLLASLAELGSDLRNGLIAGARLLVSDRLQIAATEARRIDGRYNALYRAVATTCEVCAESRVPIWQVRARRITQDEENRIIYFEDARFDLFGVPIAYLPRFSIPDPSVNRASGFLFPLFSSSDLYGYGVKFPYYRTFGDHADATISPFLTTEGAALLEGEYRQQFETGDIILEGALAFSDTGGDGFGRGYLYADADFDVGQEFELDISLKTVSDETFLREFGYSDADRLTSFISLNRYRERDYLEFRLEGYESLRSSDVNTDIPFILPEITFRQTYDDLPTGGRLGVTGNLLYLAREGGQSVLRAGGGLDWTRNWTLPRGILLTALGDLSYDAYSVADNVTMADSFSARATSSAGATLRWPLIKQGRRATHMIEPTAQLLFTTASDTGTLPNEDSIVAELDETNLFALNRFPGRDVREDGLRGNFGVTYTRFDNSGWTISTTLGQVLRTEDPQQFSTVSGLAGVRSDYVIASSFDLDDRAHVLARGLFDSSFAFRRAELEVDLDFDRFEFSGGYLFLAEDNSNPILGKIDEREEFSLEGSYRVARHWEVSGEWQYSLADARPVFAKAGITYGNECIVVDLSASRRFTDPNGLSASTDIGFQVQLAGFGARSDNRWPAQKCLVRR